VEKVWSPPASIESTKQAQKNRSKNERVFDDYHP
jgi:hypothetical protein